jgi:hypothetical protein
MVKDVVLGAQGAFLADFCPLAWTILSVSMEAGGGYRVGHFSPAKAEGEWVILSPSLKLS